MLRERGSPSTRRPRGVPNCSTWRPRLRRAAPGRQSPGWSRPSASSSAPQGRSLLPAPGLCCRWPGCASIRCTLCSATESRRASWLAGGSATVAVSAACQLRPAASPPERTPGASAQAVSQPRQPAPWPIRPGLCPGLLAALKAHGLEPAALDEHCAAHGGPRRASRAPAGGLGRRAGSPTASRAQRAAPGPAFDRVL